MTATVPRYVHGTNGVVKYRDAPVPNRRPTLQDVSTPRPLPNRRTRRAALARIRAEGGR